MSRAYDGAGKRISSKTHARRSWTCSCGKTVWGNGGKASHQRACLVAMRQQRDVHLEMVKYHSERNHTTARESAGRHQAKADEWQQRIDAKEQRTWSDPKVGPYGGSE